MQIISKICALHILHIWVTLLIKKSSHTLIYKFSTKTIERTGRPSCCHFILTAIKQLEIVKHINIIFPIILLFLSTRNNHSSSYLYRVNDFMVFVRELAKVLPTDV